MTVLFRNSRFANLTSIRVLAFGDLLAFMTFVVLGRMSHSAAGLADWLLNAPRIAAPFLAGWAVAATVLGAYPRGLQMSPRRFLLNSLLALLVGDLIAFVVRATIFSDRVTLPFALTSLAFTTMFVVGWRLLYIVAITTKSLRTANS